MLSTFQIHKITKIPSTSLLKSKPLKSRELERRMVARTEQFWSRKQKSDSHDIQNWLVARNKIGNDINKPHRSLVNSLLKCWFQFQASNFPTWPHLQRTKGPVPRFMSSIIVKLTNFFSLNIFFAPDCLTIEHSFYSRSSSNFFHSIILIHQEVNKLTVLTPTERPCMNSQWLLENQRIVRLKWTWHHMKESDKYKTSKHLTG